MPADAPSVVYVSGHCSESFVFPRCGRRSTADRIRCGRRLAPGTEGGLRCRVHGHREEEEVLPAILPRYR